MPDAGALQQQIDSERLPKLPTPAPARAAAPEPMRPSGGAAVTVREFRFEGNNRLASAQLALAVGPYLNRPLDFGQLQSAAASVAQRYREAGWVVRTYLPAQDVKDSVVTIQVVEAVFGQVVVEGPAPERMASGRVVAGFAALLKPGDPLDTGTLDRALLVADDLPGVVVAGSLTEGAGVGETELVLRLGNEPLVVGDVSADNTGDRSTGPLRVAANLALASLFGAGELVAFNGLHSQGNDYARLSASLPVGSQGWRIGTSGTYLAYRLVADDFAALDAHGTSSGVGVDASYPLVRARMANLYLALQGDRKRFDNQSSGTTTTHYRVQSATLALNGNLFDGLGGGGANSASLALVGGRVNLAGSPNEAADAASTGVAGHFEKLRWALSRQQALTQDLSVLAVYTGQAAGNNLDSSEKFYLGGAGGVRAYPAGEGGGSSGQMLNVELRWKFFEGFGLSAFHDWGRVTVNHDNGFAGAPTLNRYSLQGHGLALAWQAPAGLNLRITWARRQGANPNPTANGSDQDGSLELNRFWLTASLPF